MVKREIKHSFYNVYNIAHLHPPHQAHSIYLYILKMSMLARNLEHILNFIEIRLPVI